VARVLSLHSKLGFVSDMDGVIYRGGEICPGVRRFLAWTRSAGKRVVFLTNNSFLTPRQLQARLAALGIEAEESQFMTSALATAAFIRQQSPHGSSAFVVGGPGLHEALAAAGVAEVRVSMDDLKRTPRPAPGGSLKRAAGAQHAAAGGLIPDYVIIGEAKDEYTVDNMDIATALCARGARLVGTNEDCSDPVEGGNVVPSCGAWAAVIERASGKTAYFPGKPNAIMMRAALRAMGRAGCGKSLPQDPEDPDSRGGPDASGKRRRTADPKAADPSSQQAQQAQTAQIAQIAPQIAQRAADPSSQTAHSGDVAMIGDRLSTDVRAGMEAGMDTVLVLTGCSAAQDVERSPFRPFVVLDNIGEIVPRGFREEGLVKN
jgi:NagD protein